LRNNDCDGNGFPDNCQPDCDGDGIADACELLAGTAFDRYGPGTCTPDGIPDNCQPEADCDGDGLPDRCAILGGATDCDGDGLPDVCEPDCNSDGTIDDCEVDCNQDGVPDECQTLADCDANGVPDVCELPGNDCNANGILDRCEPDCNGNGVPDDCDVINDPSLDMDGNGIPDACECVEIDRHRPGSLLLFPKYDNRTAQRTLLTVTNVHPSQTIDVHFVFRDGATCLEFDYTRRLTPKDTITLLTSAVNPALNQGYVYAYAQSPTSGQPVVFNHLIGQALAIDGITTIEYALDAVSFEGIGNGPLTPTDVDGDGRRDLDGLEYAQAPDQILVPRFLGQTKGSASEFVFVDLSGGPSFEVLVDYLLYNDNEEAFSGQYAFRCWSCITATSLSGSFTNQFLSGLPTNDPDEVRGWDVVETGWVRFDGRTAFSTFTAIDDPAIYVVLIERHGSYAAADLPYEYCSQDNGSLLPIGPLGDE
ncbi:MAG: hypothetical protein JNK02_02995, partial [Planctomycetes bacterium]|nr:hypothetical protein [Planctomycetota bacterium]